MGWKQYARQAAADARRHQRAAAAHYRDLQRLQREQAKADEKTRAINEAARFDNYIDLLRSVHKECGDDWNWSALAVIEPPPPPQPRRDNEWVATQALESYRPGFFAKLLGIAKKQIEALQAALASARARDGQQYSVAYSEYQTAFNLWQYRRTIGRRVLAGDTSAYAEVLDHVAAFAELAEFGSRVSVASATADAIALRCEIVDGEIVPTEEVKLTASGKLSSKAMAAGRYWDLYQDHVCSCVLRIARETFAALPVRIVVVNIGRMQPNPSTGHTEFATYLAVHVSKASLARLNLENIDPSESLANFPHRMKFKKSSGFTPVDPIGLNEQWVTN